jgi:hypothetical protein
MPQVSTDEVFIRIQGAQGHAATRQEGAIAVAALTNRAGSGWQSSCHIQHRIVGF